MIVMKTHDQMIRERMQDPAFVAAYEALEEEFALFVKAKIILPRIAKIKLPRANVLVGVVGKVAKGWSGSKEGDGVESGGLRRG